jgi:hypothetical protein
MKKLILFTFYFLLLSVPSNAQVNLVPNPSFEDYTFCPSAPNQLSLATPWIEPTNDDAEYFNTCSTNPYYSVPDQVYNFQEAHSGNAFIGIFLYNGPNFNYREYAQAQLLNPLISGQCYYVEFFTNRAYGNSGGKYAVNNIACSFTNTAVNNTGTGYVLNLTPHVLEFNNSIITDTINWVKISGIYVANGGEQYITIGNFANDANTDTLSIENVPYKSAYYFFDDVSVIPIDSIIGGMPAYAGADTNVILGDSVFIGQQISNLNCNWYNADGSLIASGISGIYVNPTTTTYYVVEQNLCGTITYDTVTVTVLPTSIEAPISPKGTFSIYPNPNGGSFTITHHQNTNNYLLEIVDVMGNTVHCEILTNGNPQKIETKQLSSGIYFVKILNQQQQVSSHAKMSVVK